MCEVQELKTILDIKLKNNEPKLNDKILSYVLIECDEEKCDEKDLELYKCKECEDNFCEDHCASCDECDDLYCNDCGEFKQCDDCGKLYCNDCSGLYLQCGNDYCEKYSCCSRFIVVRITQSSDFGQFDTECSIVRCKNCFSYAYDNM